MKLDTTIKVNYIDATYIIHFLLVVLRLVSLCGTRLLFRLDDGS